MKKTLNLRFESVDASLAARRELARSFPALRVELCSNQPLPEHEAAAPGSRIGLWAFAGGLLGAAGAISLVAYTFLTMNLRTGHMDILTLAPMGIITFALTALGAVAGTLAGFLHEAKLPRWRSESVSLGAGQVLLRLESEDRTLLEHAHQEAIARGGQPLEGLS